MAEDPSNNNEPCEKERIFQIPYKCFSMSMFGISNKKEEDYGGKVIMPPKILECLLQFETINYPILFKFTNKKTSKYTHCGVLEFISDDGTLYLPSWMMETLNLDEGDFVSIQHITLPKASFVQFQPQQSEFLDITNQKAVLEKHLTRFHCLTVGDMIEIKYNEKVYKIGIFGAQPENGVCINECDMEVDILNPPVKEEPKAEEVAGTSGFFAFKGKGYRLQDKGNSSTDQDVSPAPSPPKRPRLRGIPDYDYKVGSLSFMRDSGSKKDEDSPEDKKTFEAFSGQGHSLE